MTEKTSSEPIPNEDSPQAKEVLEVLRKVIDPDFNQNIVELGFIEELRTDNGQVSFAVMLTTPACPIKEKFEQQCRDYVLALPWVNDVKVRMDSRTTSTLQTAAKDSLIHGVKNIIAVSSGKGGVGKSTVAANLAMSLSLSGAKVGLMDADIYGPSQILMFGIRESPKMDENKKLYPVSVMGGIRVVSMGMFADSDRATIWRGPMASQMIKHFIHNVHWGELDYLVIDFPPGTGDIQLSLTQSCPLSGAVVVTTPQEVSLLDVRKGLQMFETVSVPVLGVLENMSYFICDECTKKHFIFQDGGGKRIADALGLPFLGQIPIEPAISGSGDTGMPQVYSHPNAESSRVFLEIAGKVATQLAVLSAFQNRAIQNFDLKPEELEIEEAPETIGTKPPENTEDVETSEPPESHSTESAPLRFDSSENAGPAPLFLTKLAKTEDDRLILHWTDGITSVFPYRDLRLACPCAACVDEWTREPLLKPESVPDDVHPLRFFTVGRYAMGFEWSDGHKTGIYKYETLRNLKFDKN